MCSSISSSDRPRAGQAGAWRRFALTFAAALAGAGLFVFLFVATVDPWDMLPLSPPLHRIPISTNARYTMPALARSDRFDSTMIGTSTGRLLQPAVMDAPFGAHLSNMAMNSATPWEQDRLLRLFLRHHAAPRVVLIGIDASWCFASPYTIASPNRPMPGWMYEGSPWRGYADMMNMYAVQEAANQFMWLIGHKRQRFGSDGYTRFVPPDDQYDPRRVDAQFRRWDIDRRMATGPAAPPLSMPMLRRLVAAIPADTTKILWFPPTAPEIQGAPGSVVAAMRDACRQAVAAIGRDSANTLVIDFDIAGPLTAARDNFWDPLHYRMAVARTIMDDLAAARAGHPVPPAEARILVPLTH